MSVLQWTSLAEIESQPVNWLWEGRIPRGKMTVLDGEPGSGKSLLALDLAARVSRGAAMPLSRIKPSGPANVVLYNDDDSLADTVRPRLEAAGADLTRIRSVDGQITADDVRALNPALIILDPLSTYACLYGDCPPRRVLKNIAHLAKESGAAVIGVQYIAKNDPWADEAFDAARSVLHLNTIGHGRQRIGLAKSNLKSLNEVPPLVFHYESAEGSVKLAGWADSV